MTGGVNCGGGHRTQLRNNCCPLGCPLAPVYKGGGEEAAGPRGRAMGGNRIGLQVLFGPFLSYGGGKRKGEGRGEGKGGAPPPLPIWTHLGGHLPLVGCPLFSPMAHEAHDFPGGIPVTPWYSDKIPESLRTIPMSEPCNI